MITLLDVQHDRLSFEMKVRLLMNSADMGCSGKCLCILLWKCAGWRKMYLCLYINFFVAAGLRVEK